VSKRELERKARVDLVEAAGAPDRVQQVLVNLLDNANKYAGGWATVKVETADGVVRVSVADAGPGSTLAEQARVFEKLYRGGAPAHARLRRHRAGALHLAGARGEHGPKAPGQVGAGSRCHFRRRVAPGAA
jgi:K+-sensing histidine kinase KdpD